MKEQLVSFYTAKLAKDKGFDWECSLMYASNGNICDKVYDFDNWCFAPTQSLLQKWLREKHGIIVFVKIDLPKHFYISLTDKVNIIYKYNIHKNNLLDIKFHEFKTYEEALEKGLLEALKIIKNGL
jgi:hypothetical protein